MSETKIGFVYLRTCPSDTNVRAKRVCAYAEEKDIDPHPRTSMRDDDYRKRPSDGRGLECKTSEAAICVQDIDDQCEFRSSH